jgi:hypothetical protein
VVSEELAADPAEEPAAVPLELQGAGDVGWPAGSQRFPVIASSDDRPVERPVMQPSVIQASAFEASALDDSHGDVASAGAPRVEPAAE